MLEAPPGLTQAHLDAIADLERQTLAADGGRLKLEWGTLRGRTGDRVEDVLWWETGRLLGFLGLYSFGQAPVELSGMVHPEARRRGIATALLNEALSLCRNHGHAQALLVTPRASSAARALAEARGATLDHSEYALLLNADPPPGESSPRVALRSLRTTDRAAVNALLLEAFGHEPAPEASDGPSSASPPFDSPDGPAPGYGSQTLVVELDGNLVGTLRVEQEPGTTGVYGFAIAAAHRGQGIGRDVLRRICEQARAKDDSIHLEVAADNDRALGLYTSLGFTPVTTEDYWSLPLAP